MSHPPINAEELARWSILRENQFFERKSAFDRSGGKAKRRKAAEVAWDIVETLSAMANADGGELVVGLEDDGRPTGVPHPEDKISLLLRAPGDRNYVQPPLRFQKREVRTEEGLLLLHFSVDWSPKVHRLADSRTPSSPMGERWVAAKGWRAAWHTVSAREEVNMRQPHYDFELREGVPYRPESVPNHDETRVSVTRGRIARTTQSRRYSRWRGRGRMTREEVRQLGAEVRQRHSELNNVEVRTARGGTPKPLYESLSAFVNRTGSGVFLFGLDKSRNLAIVGDDRRNGWKYHEM